MISRRGFLHRCAAAAVALQLRHWIPNPVPALETGPEVVTSEMFNRTSLWMVTSLAWPVPGFGVAPLEVGVAPFGWEGPPGLRRTMQVSEGGFLDVGDVISITDVRGRRDVQEVKRMMTHRPRLDPKRLPE